MHFFEILYDIYSAVVQQYVTVGFLSLEGGTTQNRRIQLILVTGSNDASEDRNWLLPRIHKA